MFGRARGGLCEHISLERRQAARRVDQPGVEVVVEAVAGHSKNIGQLPGCPSSWHHDDRCGLSSLRLVLPAKIADSLPKAGQIRHAHEPRPTRGNHRAVFTGLSGGRSNI